MRRILALVLAALMLLSMAACASSTTATPAATETTASTENAETTETADTPATGVEDGVLTVGMECAYAPSNWQESAATDTNVPVENVAGAYAEGYQVNNLSSKQNGMGHVGTAMKLNSESIWFNPAAASFQSTQFDFSVGVTGIDSKATYTTLPDYTGKTQSRHFTSDNKIATPLYAYFN